MRYRRIVLSLVLTCVLLAVGATVGPSIIEEQATQPQAYKTVESPSSSSDTQDELQELDKLAVKGRAPKRTIVGINLVTAGHQ